MSEKKEPEMSKDDRINFLTGMLLERDEFDDRLMKRIKDLGDQVIKLSEELSEAKRERDFLTKKVGRLERWIDDL